MIHIYETDDYISQMRKKLITEIEKHKNKKKRQIAVESVFGNLKYNLGFQESFLHGHKKVRGEFNFMSIAHNLRQIHQYNLNQYMGIRLALSNYQLYTIYKFTL